MDEEPELVKRLANRMGYHLVLKEVCYPRKLSPTMPTSATFQWHNVGVAPIYVSCLVAASLLDADDNVVTTCWPPECKPKNWSPDSTVTETATLRFAEANPGSYRLAVGLCEDRKARTPRIRLAVEGQNVNGWHVLGPVTVSP